MRNAPPLMSLNEALSCLLTAAEERPTIDTVYDTVYMPTIIANRRILASNLTAPINVPSFNSSQMDGYALKASDAIATGKTLLPISQCIEAGHIGVPLQPGTAARLFTGAIIPVGADTVVMQEDCEVVLTAEGSAIRLLHIPQAGEWTRYIGEDIRQGSIILSAGMRLRAQDLALAASVGFAVLPVKRPLKVAIFSTGDELIMPGETLTDGAVYNSNRFLLTALLENLGCEIHDFGISPDTLEATRTALKHASQQSDVVITSGGVSVGGKDYIKPALQAEGCLRLWQIAIKPGKPLAFGEIGSSFFIGLPGNPVSSFVTFLLLVRPFLLRLQGVVDVAPPSYSIRADFFWPKAGTRVETRNEFLRVRRNIDGGLDLYPNQGSAVLTSLVWGDGLVDNPPGTQINQGDWVKFIPYSEVI